MKRPIYDIPPDITTALRVSGLEAAYRARPPYQRNDYVGWITRAKREATRQKRLAQMLAELERGDTYMNMPYNARKA
ncbi:MAG: YdeI/OmpD-associated family protein [Rhodothermales bacterium]